MTNQCLLKANWFGRHETSLSHMTISLVLDIYYEDGLQWKSWHISGFLKILKCIFAIKTNIQSGKKCT